jgi:hypothetical protein
MGVRCTVVAGTNENDRGTFKCPRARHIRQQRAVSERYPRSSQQRHSSNTRKFCSIANPRPQGFGR